jgi:hypothetical protein
MHTLIILLLTIITHEAFAQSDTSSRYQWQARKWREMEASEIIFSGGELTTSSLPVQPRNIVRFTLFFHFQSQWHYDFNKHFGLYTGLGLRNIGFTHEWDFVTEDLKMKHRSYSLGVPLALKFGNLEKGIYGTVGVEGEMMFAYKRKAFYNGEKLKKREWFSDHVNLWNPSAFAEVRFKQGFYIRGKVYLREFLTNKEDILNLPGEALPTVIVPERSTLGAISIGTVLRTRLKKKTPMSKDEA